MKKLRMAIDIAMTIVLVGLMAYSLIGTLTHEILIYAFFRRQIGEYLFLQTHFLFLDPSEPIIFFFLDYMAIMGLFVCTGHYLAKLLKHLDKTRQMKARENT